MRNLNFKYLNAKNFLCFDKEGLEINFKNYGNIVSITGENLDVVGDDGKVASNGSGKSSIPDAIVYALFGKTIKKPKKLSHHNLINNRTKKKMEVELHWDDYRVLRTRKPDGLRLWQSDKGEWTDENEISKSGIPATQKLIEEILGLKYETFVNIFIFSDDNTVPFLECEPGSKREIVENLLSLEKYRSYFDSVKKLTKQIKDDIKVLSAEYTILLKQLETCKKQVEDIKLRKAEWIQTKKRELKQILDLIKEKTAKIETHDGGKELLKYEEIQEQLSQLKDSLPTKETEKQKMTTALETLADKIKGQQTLYEETHKEFNQLEKTYLSLKGDVEKNEKNLIEIENKKGKKCPYCLAVVKEENFAHLVAKINGELIEKKEEFESSKGKFDDCEERLKAVQAALTKAKGLDAQVRKGLDNKQREITKIVNEISELSKVKAPDMDSDLLLFKQEVDNLKKKAMEKKEEMEGETPFESILQSSIKELENKEENTLSKKRQIDEKDELLPYYNFWVEAFGDSGIRKFVIDDIIPTLNLRLEYLLQILVDNKIKLRFNNELDETIDKYPFNNRPYVYHAMSGGQRRRLNLAISQAWAYIMMLSCGTSPSVIFLDEVTMNMDEIGVQSIYKFICELSKEKQVFVIDHNKDLLEMLTGCDRIHLQLQNEVSKKVN